MPESEPLSFGVLIVAYSYTSSTISLSLLFLQFFCGWLFVIAWAKHFVQLLTSTFSCGLFLVAPLLLGAGLAAGDNFMVEEGFSVGLL